MLDSIISFAVDRIGDFLIDETKSISGVADKVKDLQDELKWMQCYLKDAEAREETDEKIRRCISEIKNLAFDVEDCVESFSLKESLRRQQGNGVSLSSIIPIKVRKFVSEVEAIQVRISSLMKKLEEYGVRKSSKWNTSCNKKRRQLRRTYSHVTEPNVVGLEEDTEKLVAKLLDEDSSCPVVSICGMGGLGKTTLAKKVYHHPQVKSHFSCFVWVYVSQEWKTRDVWERILFRIISNKKRNEISKLDDDEIAKMLYQIQQTNKCLILLDDIWCVDAWKSLRAGFPLKDSGSRILLTTRVKEVAACVDPRGYIHEPRCLSFKESWELFVNIVCRRDQTDFRADIYMEKLAREIVGQCKGLPLAIIVLGGLLSSKYSLSEWDMVNENVKSYFRGRNNGDGDEQFGVQAVLALSYDQLPRHLKSCFLYLGIFPEDYQISVERLINLWVAEGIISPEEEEDEEILEDVAYRHLVELVERYLVQVEDRDLMGRIKTCHIHDLMRDFCMLRAERDEMFKIVNLNDRNIRWDSFSSSMATRAAAFTGNNIRRLSVHLNNFRGRAPMNGNEYPPYRSVIGFSLDGHSGIGHELIELMVDNFKLLRVVDLEEVKGFAIPAKIGNLIHLRLLNLHSAYIGKLPKSVGNWKCLLTLNLDPNNSADEIPDVIWKLERLRHLYLPRTCGRKTKKLTFANLKNLQTLVNFPSSVADMKDLLTLINIRKLIIRIDDNETKFKELMKILKTQSRFNHLRFLSINSYLYVESDDEDAEGQFQSEEEEEEEEEKESEDDGQIERDDDSGLNEELLESLSESESVEQYESEEDVMGHFRTYTMKEDSIFRTKDVQEVISCCPQLYVLTRNDKIMYQKLQQSVSSSWI